MKYETLPDGQQIPKLGFGTWNIGGGMRADHTQDERAVAAIRSAIEMGYTLIDTAEMYAEGHTEVLVRQAIEESGTAREKLFLTTKVWHTNLQEKAVVQSCEDSLRRLGTDYIDLYLIHWPNKRVPLENTFSGLNQLVDAEKIRYLGVSNFKLDLLKEAELVSNSSILTNQVPYSLHNRSFADNGMLAYCQENDIVLTAYTPIEKGRVSGDSTLRKIASKHGAAPIQIALAWLIQQPRVAAIPMSMNPAHISENLKALDYSLDLDDITQLDRVS